MTLNPNAITDNVLEWLQIADTYKNDSRADQIVSMYVNVNLVDSKGKISKSSYSYFQIQTNGFTPVFYSPNGKNDPTQFVPTYYNLEYVLTKNLNYYGYYTLSKSPAGTSSIENTYFNKSKSIDQMSDTSLNKLKEMVVNGGYGDLITGIYTPPEDETGGTDTGPIDGVDTAPIYIKTSIGETGTVVKEDDKKNGYLDGKPLPDIEQEEQDQQKAEEDAQTLQEYILLGSAGLISLLIFIKLIEK